MFKQSKSGPLFGCYATEFQTILIIILVNCIRHHLTILPFIFPIKPINFSKKNKSDSIMKCSIFLYSRYVHHCQLDITYVSTYLLRVSCSDFLNIQENFEYCSCRNILTFDQSPFCWEVCWLQHILKNC